MAVVVSHELAHQVQTNKQRVAVVVSHELAYQVHTKKKHNKNKQTNKHTEKQTIKQTEGGRGSVPWAGASGTH